QKRARERPTCCLLSPKSLLLALATGLIDSVAKCPEPLSCSVAVCKFVSIEMKSAFEETGKTKEVIDRNYRFIDGKGAAPIKYVKSWITSFVFHNKHVCDLR
uniref:DUF3456 domain-containing protein n=1 Tax=Periophthalmus magnuspinnatus TaxID=409849 RepID=A0A3B3ZW42_9GOBI